MNKTLKVCLIIHGFSLLILSTQVWGAVQSWGQINNSGKVVAIGLEVNPTSIDWGEVTPDSITTRTFNVTNTGNNPETLLINMSDFNPPEFPNYIVMETNYTGQIIPVASTLTIKQDMTILANFPSNITNFSFTTYIYGQEL